MLQRRISKLLTPLTGRSGSSKGLVRTLTVVCTPDQSTKDVLAQLKDVSENKHVTCVVLREMIQRSDNVQLFSRIQDLLRESKYFRNVHAIHLLEPHLHGDQYRRWCFKKTCFLHRVYKEAKERCIEVTIHATLILDSSSGGHIAQDISGWLSLLQQVPQDPDIKSLWISLREEAVVNTALGRRPSQLDLLQSPVQKIFQALVELFNSDTRRWQFIHCHVLYHPADDVKDQAAVQERQTQSLLEVAELFHIPLQIQWQPISTDATDGTVARITTHVTEAAERHHRSAAAGQDQGIANKLEDDDTSATFGTDGSSGPFTAESASRRKKAARCA